MSPVPISLPPRTPWRPGFPNAINHTTVRERDQFPGYAEAKAGNADAALALADGLLSVESIDELNSLVTSVGQSPILLPVTALETTGFNAIPDAMARVMARRLGWLLSSGTIVQSNTVGHTRAKAFNRLVTPAIFTGKVEPGARYVLIDDHVGLGGTLANMRGHIETSGGIVLATTALTESRDGRQIALHPETLDMLWERHGHSLDTLWRERLGHGLDCLTNIEGGILCRELSVDAIRDRMAQGSIEARGRGLDPVFRGT
jgi:hypothetical protein